MVSLSKGGNVNLSKAAPGVSKYSVGLCWDANEFGGNPFDLDASAFMLTVSADGKSIVSNPNADFIFYGNLKHPSGAIEHSGDEQTGAKAGDDETIKVDLAKMPANINEIAFVVTIHDATARSQNFGMVSNSIIKVYDDKGTEVARYELGEDFSTETAVLFGTLYNKGGEWKFKAVGQGFPGGLEAFCKMYGVPVE